MTTIFLNHTYQSIFCTLALLFSITASHTLSAATLGAGGYHTCLIKHDGTLACWGITEDGRATPPSGTFSQISVGWDHACALRTDSTLICWGRKGSDQPAPLAGNFSQVSAGGNYTCVLRTDGIPTCWGDNSDGQTAPPAGTFTQISTGWYHACGIKTDSTLACWGRNDYQQATPPEGTFSQVTANGYHSCGIQTDGTVVCWGNTSSNKAIRPPSGIFTQIAAGFQYTCGIKTDRTLACWGNNDYGQTLFPLGTFLQVSAGYLYACGVKSDGTVTCWGDNSEGQAAPPFEVTSNCTYHLEPASYFHAAAASKGTVTVTASAAECPWTVSSQVDWVTIMSGDGGRGNGIVSYLVSDNTGHETMVSPGIPSETKSRSGTLTIAGQTITVTQEGTIPNCTYLVTPTTTSHSLLPETGTLTITAPANCPWTATSNEGWISITSGESGQGNGTVTYSVSNNIGMMISPGMPAKNKSRSGTITIAGQTVTINQVGEADCTYTVTPTTVTHGYGTETGSLTITAPEGCPWNAISNVDWITITSRKGKGEGWVGYSVKSNSSECVNLVCPPSQSRSGTIAVAGQTVTITQYATLVQAVGIITTVAGNGERGFTSIEGVSNDGEVAISTGLSPQSVTVDSNGNLYIAEPNTSRIRKVDTTGIITTVAGNGKGGFSGDGGPATSAQLNNPKSVIIDSNGNLYIADFYNHRIRKVDTTGIITTVAGNGVKGFSGDGGVATNAQLSSFVDVAITLDSSGNLYITDNGNHRIRKVDAAGIISTIAGNGESGFSGDGGVATNAQFDILSGITVDSGGNLYIADAWNYRIRKIDTTGIISTVAGNGMEGYSGDGGPATNAQLNGPSGVAVDSKGNLYIADLRNNRIRKVDTTGIISTVAGNGVTNPIRESVSPSVNLTVPTFSGDGGPATDAQLDTPTGVAVDNNGNIYIADTENNRIRKVTFNNSTQPKVEVANPLVSQAIYQTGDTIRVTLPPLPTGPEQYVGIGLPNGSLYLLNQLNSFILFDNVTFPVWSGGEVAIEQPVTADLPSGLYTVYLLRMPTGVSPSSVKMEDWALGSAVFMVASENT